MLLGKVPAPGANQQHRHLLVELVFLAVGRGKIDLAANRVAHVHLAVQRGFPGGSVGVLEVGHIGLRAGVQRVNDHLAIDGSRNLYAAVLKIRRNGVNVPVTFADLFRLRKEVRKDPTVKGSLAFLTLFEQFQPTRIEGAMQRRVKRKCFLRKDFRVCVRYGSQDFQALGHFE